MFLNRRRVHVPIQKFPALCILACGLCVPGFGSDMKSKTTVTDTVLVQSRLQESKAWKDYKSLQAEAARMAESPPKRDSRDLFKPMDAKTKAWFGKLKDRLAGLRAPIRDLFPEDMGLSADLVSLLGDKIGNAEEALRPKPGRRPKPDFAAEAGQGYLYIQRGFRIVEAFKRIGLQDSLIDAIRDSLPKVISHQRQALQSLSRKEDAPASIPIRPAGPTRTAHGKSPGTDSLDPAQMEAELFRMESLLNAWYDEDVERGSKPPRKYPDQAALDRSEAWMRYSDLHRTLAGAKTESDLGFVKEGIRKLKPALDTLFRDDTLTSDLIAWQEALIASKQSVLGPKAKPHPDAPAWAAIWETYQSLKIRFRIARSFREKELEHPLIRTMASPLPIEIGNLKGELKLLESDGKAAHAGQSAEIKAFVKSSEAEFAAQKKKSR